MLLEAADGGVGPPQEVGTSIVVEQGVRGRRQPRSIHGQSLHLTGSPAGSVGGYRCLARLFGRLKDALFSRIGGTPCQSWPSSAPGNVVCPRQVSGLPRDSVVNVSALLTIDRHLLSERVGLLPGDLMERVDEGLRLVLTL